jgi:histidyl-tRNA synthetase
VELIPGVRAILFSREDTIVRPPHLHVSRTRTRLPPIQTLPGQVRRMELCAALWAAGIRAEFGYKPNPKMADNLGFCHENGVPYMVLFGDDELSRGVVKIKVRGPPRLLGGGGVL